MDVKWVDWRNADTCPHCKKKMGPTEGASELFESGVGKVWCAFCDKVYYHTPIPDEGIHKSIYILCDECKKSDVIGTVFTGERALKYEICCNCGKEI